MNVIIDGKTDFTLEPHMQDMMGVLAAINQKLHAQGRAILAVKADGQPISPQRLAVEFSGKLPGEVSKLEIQSEQISVLVETSLRELRSSLPDLVNACHILSEVFQSDSPEDGYAPFERLADIWHAVKLRETLVANALGMALDELLLDNQPIARVHEELNQYLEEAADALRCGDCITLGDLLEYELAPRAETELRIVDVLQQLAQERAG